MLVEVLGRRDEPGVDQQTVVHEYGLRVEFPDEVLEAAREAASGFDEETVAGRVDFTGLTVVTIDPSDAATSMMRSRSIGLTREVGDWGSISPTCRTSFSRGGALDREARLRGTSTYLPGQVIPMLPELISNGWPAFSRSGCVMCSRP
ncbi:MAG: hypothetical protein CM1200mP2_34650 [Planctomycetaceae bacterium]|nr:MAG: hypothetical protein CM1200mP2_34650 [Planctomycetaceae bacterium]